MSSLIKITLFASSAAFVYGALSVKDILYVLVFVIESVCQLSILSYKFLNVIS